MSYSRPQMHRPDTSQEGILKALRKAGLTVEVIGRPVDLLTLKRTTLEEHLRTLTYFEDGTVLSLHLLDTKTARGKKNPKAALDKRQVKQNEFCARWNIPKPTTPMEALLAVGEKVEV